MFIWSCVGCLLPLEMGGDIEQKALVAVGAVANAKSTVENVDRSFM